MNNRKKSVLLTAISAFMLMTMTACGASSDKLIAYINEDDFEGAVDYWKDKINRTEQEDRIADDLIDFMIDYYPTMTSKYSQGILTEKSLKELAKLADEASFDESDEYLSFLSDISIIDDSIESYNQGLSHFDNEEYDLAVEYFEDVAKIDTAHYSLAQDKINEVDEKVEQKRLESVQDKIKEIEEKITDKAFTDAKSALESLEYDFGDMDIVKEAKKKLEDAVLANADESIKQYFSEMDFDGAKNYLSDLMNNFSYDDLEKKSNSLKDDYINYILEETKKLADGGDYEKAVDMVYPVLQANEDNDDLMKAYNEYRAYTPIYITAMEYMASDGESTPYNPNKDNVGTVYDSGLYIDGWGEKEFYEIFYTNGRYKTFSGTVAVAAEQKDDAETKYFEVWGDGVHLYSSSTLGKGSLPEQFSVDISGVQQLKIWYPPTPGSNGIATIFNGLLTPAGKNETTEAATEAPAPTEAAEVSEETPEEDAGAAAEET